jgi:thymidylate synthase
MFHNTYELGIYDPSLDLRIYDPTRDANRRMNRQCLSFLSFKLDSERRLSLTAVYRNHFYVARLLGNMIGLGRLLEFVTIESGAKIGSLTILSTHAEVDTFKWNRQAIKQLIDVCGKC